MNPFHLQQKTAIVTGAGSGIGRAIAELFADQGARVWVVDRDEACRRARPWPRIRAAEGWAEVACADVSSAADVAALEQTVGPVDILVNNAGIGHVGTLLGTTHEDLDRLYAVNVRGVFNCAKAFATGMLGRGRGSVVLARPSIGGIVAVRERLAYTTTKFAVVGITKALALDHSHTGVRFNCICPGRVETPFVKKRLSEYPDPEQAYRDMASTQLNGRMAQPGEVAAAAALSRVRCVGDGDPAAA